MRCKQTVVLWVSLLLVGGLAFLILRTPTARAWLWEQTGEEDFGAQVKGVSDRLADLLRPRLHLAPDAAIAHTDVNPFGVNVFLEQEADPAKRALAVQMAAEAGYHWLRQEFPWEDIEIHGKGDFEDRRHEPYRSAWEKYDQIVDLAEQHDMELIVRLSNPPDWSRAQGDAVGEFAPPDNVAGLCRLRERRRQPLPGRVHYYQLWNEPNIYPEWGIYPIDPEAYVELLKAGAQAARAADPRGGHHRRRAGRHHQPPARRPAARQQPERPDLLAAHVRRRCSALLRHHGRAGLWPVERPDRPAHAPARAQHQPPPLSSRPDGRERRRHPNRSGSPR